VLHVLTTAFSLILCLIFRKFVLKILKANERSETMKFQVTIATKHQALRRRMNVHYVVGQERMKSPLLRCDMTIL
jgi:hypothetical protein